VLALLRKACDRAGCSCVLQVETYFSTLTDYWIGLRRTSSTKPYIFTNGEAGAAGARRAPCNRAMLAPDTHNALPITPPQGTR
jgi:hypothetical protein